MNKSASNSSISQFLKEVTEQISYKPLRPSIRQELEDHMNDRMEEYKEQGFSPSDAERQTLRNMGDAVTIGMEINEAHKIQEAPQLTFISLLLLCTGFIFTSFMQWRPKQMADSSLYYITGAVILTFTVLKGYPLLIRYRKSIALFTGFLYLTQILLFIIQLIMGNRYGLDNITYFATLLFIPVLTVLFYCSRQNKKRFLTAALTAIAVWLLFMYAVRPFLGDTAVLIFILSASGTVFFMIHRGILTGKKIFLYPAALAFTVLLGSPFYFSESGRQNVKVFLSPQSSAHRTLDDAYNGILIQELLSKSPLMQGLKLTPEEMLDYGTGAWYFIYKNPKNVRPDEVKSLKDINYHLDDVTLWDILPQHYYNNYMIAVFIFLFGWIPGLLLIGVIGLFYLLLFSYTARIHGKLASSLAFSCCQCLLWQGVLYLLGNFGHQFATFPNLPLISEGQLSIIFNMIILGLIFSAYRHDHVMEDPINFKPIASV
ncbi:permease prefix domain 1-containing protein [Clostridium boliviensis]|uniref:Permease prefix domain 1-containing protein n=1 Tax=Clostridium boliviensis TaxID=318465 RepID=A0ABU4GNQ3_9CLOT|nr:permease prefix domain 1-containing protein [Clostridium boliviensis]MDW2798630.1 permease prefix domain 1-containing protein [Clostridium boliviensis]